MYRLFEYVASIFAVAAGAVMLTQAVYDPSNASLSFRALALLLTATGAACGVRLAKSHD